MATQRIVATEAARDVIRRLAAEYGDLVFSQSGGCCDGARPICLQKSDYYVKTNDVLLGQIEGFNYYLDGNMFDYWKNSQLTLDVMDNMSGSFSLEDIYDKSFIIRSRIFSDAELQGLPS